MQIRFTSVAENEFQEAIAWYNQQSEGLGDEFSAEINKHSKGFKPILTLGLYSLKILDDAIPAVFLLA